MVYVLAVLLIAAWVYLSVLGFRLNRESTEAPAAAPERRPAQQAGGQTAVTE